MRTAEQRIPGPPAGSEKTSSPAIRPTDPNECPWSLSTRHSKSSAGVARKPVIDLREPVGNAGRRCFFRRGGAFCRGVLPCIFDPAVLCRLPVDFLKIEIAETVEILGELRAASLESGHAGEPRRA